MKLVSQARYLGLNLDLDASFSVESTIDNRETIKRKFCSRYVLFLLLFYIVNIPL